MKKFLTSLACIILGTCFAGTNNGGSGYITPPAESYVEWLDRFEVSEAHQDPKLDLSGDGISNAKVYSLGLDPYQNQYVYISNGDNFSFTKQEDATYTLVFEEAYDSSRDKYIDLNLQYSVDLKTWFGMQDPFERLPKSDTKPPRLSFTYPNMTIEDIDRLFFRVQLNIKCGRFSNGESTQKRFYKYEVSNALGECPSELQTLTCNYGVWESSGGTYEFNTCSIAQPDFAQEEYLGVTDISAAAEYQGISEETLLTNSMNETFLSGPLGFVAGDENVFSSYSVTGQSTYSTGWTSQFDFTGVAWSLKKSGTLITRQHIVQAKHYHSAVGDEVVFHDKNGNRHPRTITALRHLSPIVTIHDRNFYPDSTVLKLNEPLPVGIKHYKLARINYIDTSYTGVFPVIATDQFRNVRLLHFDLGLGYNGTVRYRVPFPGTYSENMTKPVLVSGDSGNPTFMVVDGNLVLSSTHHTSNGQGPYFGDPAIQHRVIEAVNLLGY